jgi:hypothetical protein
MGTDPVINLYRNFRLGPNPGQFTLHSQPPVSVANVNFPGILMISQPNQSSAVMQFQPQQPVQPSHFTISAIIEESIDGNNEPVSGPSAGGQNNPVHVIQQTTVTIPTELNGQQGAQQLSGQWPFNTLGLQLGQPSDRPVQQPIASRPSETVVMGQQPNDVVR